MRIFQLKAYGTNGVDYDIGFYATKSLAEAKIAEIKKKKGWRYDWSTFQIWERTVEGVIDEASWEVDRLRAEGAYDSGRDGWS